MKTRITALMLALSLTAVPALAQGFDMGTLTPTLDFPEPTSEPVTQGTVGINK